MSPHPCETVPYPVRKRLAHMVWERRERCERRRTAPSLAPNYTACWFRYGRVRCCIACLVTFVSLAFRCVVAESKRSRSLHSSAQRQIQSARFTGQAFVDGLQTVPSCTGGFFGHASSSWTCQASLADAIQTTTARSFWAHGPNRIHLF